MYLDSVHRKGTSWEKQLQTIVFALYMIDYITEIQYGKFLYFKEQIIYCFNNLQVSCKGLLSEHVGEGKYRS